MAKKRKVRSGDSSSKSIELQIIDHLNSKGDDGNVACTLDGEGYSPPAVSNFISTGLDILNIAIANRLDGGYPCGRIIEIFGMESTGKSLLAYGALKSTQDMGGIGVFLDTENSNSKEFIKSIGVDTSKMVYSQPESIEDCFSIIENIIMKIREIDSEKLITIVLDSVMAAPTKSELEGTFEKEGYATHKAIIISKAMRKITNLLGREKVTLILINQLRSKLGGMAYDNYTTSGGLSIAFHSSVRLKIDRMSKIYKNSKKEEVIGFDSKVTVIKNKIGPPMRTVFFPIYFAYGVDNFESWFEFLKKNKLLNQSGAWYSFEYVNPETGEIEENKFLKKQFSSIIENNPQYREYLLSLIKDKLTFKYGKEEENESELAD